MLSRQRFPKPVEEEVASLSLIRQVSSVNIAGMSIVTAEFEYAKGLEPAAVDVNNAVNKVRGKLPPEVNPSIYTAGSHVLPVDVFALSAAGGGLTLDDVRKIAESDIKPALLRNPMSAMWRYSADTRARSASMWIPSRPKPTG
ncbi:MAG: efflux RND transporter permease subunit [Desulfobacterales bacterium]|nr:efflux RND transporter permease subunit [Desulfobacterales bacterium]